MSWLRIGMLLAVLALVPLRQPTVALADAISEDEDGPQCSPLTNGDDTFNGGPGADIVCGLAGDDVLHGGGGNDGLDGGPGNDLLDGGDGDDSLSGGDGDDVLMGGRGSDGISGGRGDDQMLFQPGDVPARRKELINGGPGADTARFFFGSKSSGPCPRTLTDPVTGGKYEFKSVETCAFGP